ncbi:MAG TPA: kelch repeat-containing protein, partial [Candidatus Eisenbacteria bacterium]
PPPGRVEHSAIYDVTNDRMVVFGGYNESAGSLNDVWVLAFSGTPTWSPLSPGGTPPAPRYLQSAVYDEPHNRMVMFGGYAPSTTDGETNDAWALSLTGSGSWTLITPNGGPPPTRYGHNAVVDAPRNRMIVFGGFSDLPAFHTLGDAWTLSFNNPIKWTQLGPTGPTPVPAWYFASVYDPVRERVLLSSADEFWALSGLAGTPSWSILTPPGQVPRLRTSAVVVYDPPRQRMLLFGGFVFPEDVDANDLWAYTFATGSWARLTPSGASPSPRSAAAAIYDPGGDRVVLFGGSGENPGNETWQLGLGGSPAWSQLTPAGTAPTARFAHTAILDPPNNRMVIYGGNEVGNGIVDEVWALSLSGGTTWSQLNPSGDSPPVEYHTAVFDAPRNRMLALGDNGSTSTVRALSLSGPPAWTTLATAGTPPPAPYHHTASYDPVRDRMLVGMGYLDLNATYALDLSGTPTWSAIGSPTALPDGRSDCSSLFDAANDRWVVFGGVNYEVAPYTRNDVVALSFPPAYPLNLTASPAVGGAVQANPAGECEPANAQVTLTAVPAATYGFVNWSGDASGTANPITVTMDAAKNITANFATYPVNVAVSPSGSGTVVKSPNQATYPPGAQVTLTATPATGYGFVGWSGDASGATNPVTITVDGPKNITASFVGYPVNVTVSPAGSGTVTKNPNQATYAPGSQMTLTASNSFPFLGWSGDAGGTDNPLSLTVDGPKNITASFEAYTVTTAVAPAGTGTVSKTPNQAFYAPGTGVMLTASPSLGYQFDSWSGDVVGTGNPTTPLVSGNISVTANFSLVPPGCGTWTLTTAGGPSARAGSSMVWDPVRHRMLAFGGYDGSFLNQVWQLSTAGSFTWTQLFPTGTPPSPRDAAGMIYDPVRDRVLVIGGNAGGVFVSDVWELSLSGSPAWTSITASGTPPVGRFAPSVVYDSVRDRLLLFGGQISGSSQDDVWSLALAGAPAWSQLAPTGTPPAARYGHAAIYDPVRDRMVIFGGYVPAPANDAWSLSLAGTPAWSLLAPVGVAPQAVSFPGAAYDPIRDRMVVTGGWNGSSAIDQTFALAFKYQPLWSKVNVPPTLFGPRYFFASAYESDHDLITVFGGFGPGSSTRRSDVVRRDFAGGYGLDAGGTDGTVNLSPSKGCYGNGETVTLQATPASGHHFSQWLGDASGTNPTIDVTMNGHKTIVAEFGPGDPVAVEEQAPEFALSRIQPNPSRGPTRIEYSLARPAHVRLAIYDLVGREVTRLVDEERPGGRHSITWSARMGSRPAPSGIYLVRYQTPQGTWVQRLALLR